MVKSKLFNMIKRNNPNLTEDSVEIYARRVKRLHELFYETELKSTSFLRDQVIEVITFINSLDVNANVRVNYYTAILATVKKPAKIRDLYNINFMVACNKQTELSYEQKKTKKETMIWLKPDQIKSGRKVLIEHLKTCPKGQKFFNSKRLFMYNLYTILPPRRCDYGLMKINPSIDEQDCNMVFTDDERKFKKFVFKKFKLSNYKEVEEFDREFMSNLPNGNRILTVLDWWLKINKDSVWLFGKRSAASVVSKSVRKVFNRATGLMTNINCLRHIYISNMLDNPIYLREKMNVAKFMSHSVLMQEVYRRRVPEEIIATSS